MEISAGPHAIARSLLICAYATLLLGSVAQFEREIMLERQREGTAKAKAAGKCKGGAPTARAKEAHVAQLPAQGISLSEIAWRLGIGNASVHRILKARRPDSAAVASEEKVQ
ncbi:hypothetical protein LJR009_003588 [Bosea sp. LjRoot9]|uniref:hypothetical protein n=1 Tax=Bosea sp. LjRoot9 TaxID=3342341 RepID=UPI003ED08C53